jgi:hypothetical protein
VGAAKSWNSRGFYMWRNYKSWCHQIHWFYWGCNLQGGALFELFQLASCYMQCMMRIRFFFDSLQIP